MMLIYVIRNIKHLQNRQYIKNEKQERQILDKNNGYMQKFFKFNIYHFLNLRRL